MIIEAITENDPQRKGMSFISIQKIIRGMFLIEGQMKVYVKKAFEKLNEKKIVERVSGTKGITGSIRLTKIYVDNLKKKQTNLETINLKSGKNVTKKTKENKAEPQTKKDKNNNASKKGNGKAVKVKEKVTAKPKPKPAASKLNPKKTAITKTKIDRSGGKVRLSIMAAPDPLASIKTTKAIKGKRIQTKATEVSGSKQKSGRPTKSKPETKKV
uniref:H15 domain-containing protein n=1 Tax=Anopheles farauti TaxID=69004 RepID=A0A182Q9E8_9DIPT